MAENEFEYFLMDKDNGYCTYRLLNDDARDSKGTSFVYYLEPAPKGKVGNLVFEPKTSKKPAKMPDGFDFECRIVFSKKIYDVLKDVSIKDFQLVPAIIRNNKGEEFPDYWIANIYREFAFLDKEKSEASDMEDDDDWGFIEKMVINKELMSRVPLAERLVYVSKESSGYVLWHKSIVDLIMSINPAGLYTTAIETC
jgi:hypothetical protein